MNEFKKVADETEGQERADILPMWSGNVRVGGIIAGEYVGSDTFQAQDKDGNGNAVGPKRTVTFIKLRDVAEYIPDADDPTKGTTAQHLALGVPLNGDTKAKLDPDTLSPGCRLLIKLRELDPAYRNMRRYDVKLITEAAHRRLLVASSSDQ